MTVQSDMILDAMSKIGRYSEIRLVMKGGEELVLRHGPRGWVVSNRDDVINGEFMMITNGPEMEIIVSEYHSPLYKRISMFVSAISRIEAYMADGSGRTMLWEESR